MTSINETGADGHGAADRTMVRMFRQQIHALGALWIIIGSLSVALAIVALQGNSGVAGLVGNSDKIVLAIVFAAGAIWFVLGLLTCLKKIWAVYVGLVLSYLSLAGQALNVRIIGVVIMILVILQAHRVIGWSKQMRAAGVPLTAKA